MLRLFDSIAAAADAAGDFIIINQATLPPHMAERLLPYTRRGQSPVDLIVNFTESVYANSEELPTALRAEALELAAGLALLCDHDGYHGKLDGRAAAMSFALRRDSGEKAGTGRAWPKKADDPAPSPDHFSPERTAALAALPEDQD